jgi:hypothetical protein
MDVLLKDPAARLDVAVDWTAWLEGRGVSGTTWRVRPAGALTISANGVEGCRAVARVEGGREGCVYRLTNQLLCADGSRDARELVVRVGAR